MFDGSAAKLGEDVIAAVQKETDALAAKQAEAQPAPEETAAPDAAEKTQLLDFLAAAPEAEGDPYADQPTVTAPELPTDPGTGAGGLHPLPLGGGAGHIPRPCW